MSIAALKKIQLTTPAKGIALLTLPKARAVQLEKLGEVLIANFE